jgi:drug/metabolite transporter (DMT)-like permease
MKLLLMILTSVALSGAGQLLLRAGARAVPVIAGAQWGDVRAWLALLSDWRVLLGLVSWAVSTALWLVVLNRAELSYAYVLGSLNYVLVPLAAYRLFEEPVGSVRLIGMLVIFAGVIITLCGRVAERGGP